MVSVAATRSSHRRAESVVERRIRGAAVVVAAWFGALDRG